MDMSLYITIAVKLVVALIGLLIMTRLLGKKEISQLTAFDFVSSLMLSELVGNTIYDPEVHLSHLLFALLVWTLLALGLEKFIAWMPWLSRYAAGTPDLVIKDGVIDFKAMKRNNLDFAQLGMLLRENNVFSLREVAYALFETNGSISVLRQNDPDSMSGDAKNQQTKVCLPESIIENGHINEDALKRLGRDSKWLNQLLQLSSINRHEEVLYAEWSDSNGLFYQLK
ncbi:DUF421 domain-containing protein [Paenibacillus marchantiophytorum]|uniref:DUF421 domain-containing protein n=1 Tax=Paenibacillus marchantiophytorum TaxID=1619310 RepID=A0ABQ1F4B1_9BACL|nr:DUF421 domain-containing protein [Paenibacillus marchantiophytorum]GFZ98556.1 DUF421 domain-containing protein [Paenibacillus marchantiophytorum]